MPRDGDGYYYLPEWLKNLAVIVTATVAIGGGLFAVGRWVFDVQLASAAKTQHETMAEACETKRAAIVEHTDKALKEQRDEVFRRIDVGFGEVKDEIRGLQRRVDAQYRAQRGRQ